MDTKTGDINQHVELEYHCAQNIQVYNNYVVLHLPAVRIGTEKYLYKERLPYNFGAATVRKGELVNTEE